MPAISLPKSIQTEIKTVEAMIELYCGGLHSEGSLCRDCGDLRHYARARLEYCRFGADKPTCVKCPVHCYKPDMREKIRSVMRYAGPKMLFRHPWLALVHLWKEWGFFKSLPKTEPDKTSALERVPDLSEKAAHPQKGDVKAFK